MDFSANLLAASACAWKAAVPVDAVASWLIKVTTRFMTLQKQNTGSWTDFWAKGLVGQQENVNAYSQRKTANPEM